MLAIQKKENTRTSKARKMTTTPIVGDRIVAATRFDMFLNAANIASNSRNHLSTLLILPLCINHRLIIAGREKMKEQVTSSIWIEISYEIMVSICLLNCLISSRYG